MFKTYINHYQIGESWVSGGERILVNEKTGDEIWLNQISMFEPTQDNEYHACLDYIFSYEQLIIEIEKYHNEVENWNKLGFVQIGLMHWSDVLLLGVEDTNREEIWRYGTGDLKKVLAQN
ncbi:MAG: hypothetical protein IPH36_14905 [Saprospiraceae bacterium]|nr:hypothetical protein [Saprospiraceae bacterium]